MSDERIHKHDWQGGRCITCGLVQREEASELPPADGCADELRSIRKQLTELQNAVKEVKREAGDKGHTIILLVLWILLLKSC
jgi:hypothetical protein